MSLDAGHILDGTSELKRIFTGDLNFVRHLLRPPEWISTLEGGDAAVRFKKARIAQSFPAGTPKLKVLDALLDKFGLKSEQMREKLRSALLRDGGQEFKGGKVLIGKVSTELTKLLKSFELDYSIQDGQLFATSPGEALSTFRVILSPETGLIGNPEIGDLFYVKARTLLNGDLVPGNIITVKSRAIPDGEQEYKLLKVRHTGDTHRSTWYSDIEAKPVTK